jgi:hypothetical protein
VRFEGQADDDRWAYVNVNLFQRSWMEYLLTRINIGSQPVASSQTTDILVTAGHCVYDCSGGLGRVKQMLYYMGYHGQGARH